MGGAAGQSIYITISTTKLTDLIPAKVVPAALGAGLPETSLPEFLGILTGVVTTAPITSVPGISLNIIEASTLALKQAYRQSFKYVWLASIPFGIVSLVCAMCTKDVSQFVRSRFPKIINTILAFRPVDL
jgi:hypothetical protein